MPIYAIYAKYGVHSIRSAECGLNCNYLYFEGKPSRISHEFTIAPSFEHSWCLFVVTIQPYRYRGHCEERSDEAISGLAFEHARRLRRSARNDGRDGASHQG